MVATTQRKVAAMKRRTFLAWLILLLGAIYFILPLYSTFDFSLRMQRDTLSFLAYERVIQDRQFISSFLFSVRMALMTIFFGVLLIVPTAYWVHLRLPRLRPLVELFTLLPFVMPVIVLVFGLIRTYSGGVLRMTSTPATTDVLLVAGYMVISLPYLYRSVDIGLRAMDVRSLTEAAQSLGAGWGTILFRIILPNLRTAVLTGALLTVAIVIGELTLAQYLARPAFGPYMALLGQNRAFEPAALAIMSFGLTWAAMGMIFLITRGRAEGQIGGGH
jgi:putative spermidine/putrescine transport system permease protein